MEAELLPSDQPENPLLTVHNGRPVSLDKIPRLSFVEFRRAILQAVSGGRRVVALFGQPDQESLELFVVLGADSDGLLEAGRTYVKGLSYPSLTPECPQVHLFEREIAETWGFLPEGHPWLKPVRFSSSRRSDKKVRPRPEKHKAAVGITNFYRMEGDEIHEVAVGPVHAGVIEPGHFRFQCYGETVFHLEISLGYQHRGIERALLGKIGKRSLHYLETLAGDTTIGHTMAYCQAVEGLATARVSARAQALRGIALELERMANHTGDLGALSGDIGFLPTASFCGRIRGDFLNLTALLCGSRFGRGLVRLGGVGFDVDKERVSQLVARLDSSFRDLKGAANLLWSTASVQARFEDTGRITADTARELGLVGLAARACGIRRDVRKNYPTGIYQFTHIPITTLQTGDVFARAYLRWLEMERSATFIRNQLRELPGGAPRLECASPKPNQFCVSLVEGWRGEICHIAITDDSGGFSTYKAIDPSFHNWTGLAMALRDQQISDFPLCNKSFNLSYCGHDL